MATKHHITFQFASALSMLLALAIGSAPVVALLTLQQPLASAEGAQ